MDTSTTGQVAGTFPAENFAVTCICQDHPFSSFQDAVPARVT